MSLSSSEIAEERRRGWLAGVAAVLAGLLFPAGLIWAQIINRDRPDDNAPAELRFFDRHATELVASSLLRALALVLLMYVALYLYRATKARSPSLNALVVVMAVFGPLALAAASLAHDVYLAFASADFTGREFQSVDAAEDLTKGSFVQVSLGLSLAGTLALAFWFVIGSLNAMRVGLLTRFMGILGIIIGVSFVLGLALPVMVLWLIALGALLTGRWPAGLPPAWERGEAVPWPSREERLALEPEQHDAEAVGGSRNGDVEPVGPGVRRPDPRQGGPSEPVQPRRKRKRRL
jgi:uncharacterized protein DUF4386